MRADHGAALVATLLVLLPVASAHAQAGRADLRYASPMPATITFTTVDSIESTTSGMSTGDVTTSGTIRTVNEMRFMAVANGIAVTATLRSMSGRMATPTGTMPLNLGESAPIRFTMGAGGPDPAGVSLPGMSGLGASPDDMGSSRALAGLVAIPGRALSPGEGWVDTVLIRIPPTAGQQGLAVEVTAIIRGTYASDTTIAGRALNVLRISTETTPVAQGEMQGTASTQNTTFASEEIVLWDSARHFPMLRDAVTQSRSESQATGVTLLTTDRVRSITTAAPRG